MNEQQIDDAVREMARRWYFNGSLDGGLGRDTDEAEERHVDIHATIKQMAFFGTALASRVRAAEQERCAVKVETMRNGHTIEVTEGTLIPDEDGPWFLKSKMAAAIRAPRPERQA